MNRTLRGFLKKEFRQVLRDPRMRVLIFVAPLIQLTLFGVAISNEVKNLKLAVVASPQDLRMQEISDHAIATGWFLKSSPNPKLNPVEWVQSGEADAVLIAPPEGLDRSLQRGKAPLQLLVNATNVVRAQAVENYIQGILFQLFPPKTRPVLEVDLRVLYNPTLKTSHFMVPGVMGMLLCLVTIVLTSMSIAREREMGTLETLISAPVKTWEVVLGKSIPFVALGMVQFALVLLIAFLLFQVPFQGPLLLVFLSGFLYICATVSIGVLISTIAKNQQQAMLGGFLFLMPALLLSGLMFPLENMPKLLIWVTYANPLAHFITLMRNLLLKGGDAGFVTLHLTALFTIAVILGAFSFRQFRKAL